MRHSRPGWDRLSQAHTLPRYLRQYANAVISPLQMATAMPEALMRLRWQRLDVPPWLIIGVACAYV